MEMVSREYLLKAFNAFNDTKHAPEGWFSAMRTAREIVEEAPSVDINRGRWVRDECGELYCSECGRYTEDRHDMMSEFEGMKCIALVPPNYCGYCGAYMKGDET